MVRLTMHQNEPGERLMGLIRNRLSASQAVSLSTLERELRVDANALLSGLRTLMKAGSVEELVPVVAGRGPFHRRALMMRERCFYRLVRDTDGRYEWEQAPALMPPAEMARCLQDALCSDRRKGGA